MATEKKEFQTWNGKKIVFYPNSHRYKLGDQYLLSPSAIVGIVDKSTPLLIWNDNLIKQDVYSQTQEVYTLDEHRQDVLRLIDLRNVKIKEAQNIGTAIHKYVEDVAYATTAGVEMPPLPEGIDPKAVEAFLSLQFKNDILFDDVEQFVYSEKHGYCGLLDARIVLNSKKTLTDWKTSKSIYFTHKVQLAGYDLAMEEEYGGFDKLPYEQLAIIHLDKNTGESTVHILSPEERDEARKAFLHALELKKLVKKYDTYKE